MSEAKEEARNATVKVTVKLPKEDSHSNNAKHAKKASTSKNNDISFEISRESKIQTILDVLAMIPSSKYLTNVSLRAIEDGSQLSEEVSIKDIVGEKSDIKLQLVMKPYSAREALKHVITVRDFIGFAQETSDGLSEFAISTGSNFSSLPLGPIKEASKQEEKKDEGNPEGKKSTFKNVSENEKLEFNKMVHEVFSSFKSSSVNELLTSESNIITPCVRSLSFAAYNPVPPFYRTKGHLFYLQIVTLEGENFYITAIPSGFYVNRSNSTKFDPSPKENTEENVNPSLVHYSLFDLISSRSKKFVSHVQAFEKRLSTLDSTSYVRPNNTFLHKPWFVSSLPANSPDYLRLQTPALDTTPERNFNDEFQAIKDLATSTLQDRIEMERLFAKVVHEFSVTAAKGAMSIFYSDFIAMNPESPIQDQIFLKDNIFYSFVSDVSGNFKGKGGDEAAIAASNQDLKTINILNRLHMHEVRYLLTTVVEFAGRRILAQTPVPGLLATMGNKIVKDVETGEEVTEDFVNDINVKYGLDEGLEKIVYDADFEAVLEKKFVKAFHLKKHKVDDTELVFSSQSKGIVGFDKRRYILDLANTYPLDINFARENFDEFKADDVNNRYPHRQTLLRPELVEKWWNEKIEKEGIEFEKAYDENRFSYNPDAYQIEGVEDPTVDEISTYLQKDVIPSVIQDYLSGNLSTPYNGEHLADTLHKNGINMRYLGKIIELSQKELESQTAKYEENLKTVEQDNKEYEEWEKSYLQKIEAMIKERQAKINKLVQEGKDVPKELTEDLKLNDEEIKKPTDGKPVVVAYDELLPLIKIAELEIVSRSLKHVLKDLSKDVPIVLVPSLVAYVFNMLVGTNYNANPKPEPVDEFYPVDKYSFAEWTRSELLESISKQAALRFRHHLPSGWIETYMENPFALIRSVSYKFGVQLLNKEYFFTKEQLESYKQSLDKKIRNKYVEPVATFSLNDLTIIPRVKLSEYTSSVSEEFWAQGASMINEDKQTALTLLAQSITVLEDVNNILHPTVAEKYLSLSAIYNKLALYPEAIAFCRKACTIYERVSGIDSFEMMRALTNLAVLEFSNESPYNAAVIYNRLAEILKVYQLPKIHHPAPTSIFNHLEQLALGVQDTKLAIEVLGQLSSYVVELEGKESLAYGYTESRLGNLFAALKDFHRALEHITVTQGIFTKQLGMNHTHSAQSRQWVNGLNSLIVDLKQKKQLAQDQTSAAGPKPANTATQKKNNRQKKDDVKPELADKSVDELLTFIEGDSSNSANNKSKNKKKHGKK
ncbi:translation initiation factor 3 subunit CLU1 [Saccharomyces eubayanus]|uniref:translation initiation factor 3 subunit CLU1 n=1 Tax=Saccharomyces eubayanus TaxID=1080349 RepID=UPI0006C5A0D0|nr:CLU1-like protein [Saccharomyces eubayanus]KOG97356.1 CLU1-like protein [Saccharomyces eubayanus]